MTEFLVRKFVKNYDNLQDQTVRTRYGLMASVVGIICNVFLFVVKFLIGCVIHSITVTADSFNNLSDAASSIIGFVGVRMANRPADKEHPFGHGRAEYIAALIVAFLVIEVGFTCFKSSISKVFHPELIEFNVVLVVILALSILVKVWMTVFNKKLGKRINSKVMLATSADARGDVIITSATVLSILIGQVTEVAIDGYAGVVVSLFVLMSGINIARDTLEPILGEAIDRTLYDELTKKIESYEGILGSHDLIVHSYGPTKRMATIHAEVPNTFTMEFAHELVDRIEQEIRQEMGIFLTIHTDPVEVNDDKVLEQKALVVSVLKELEPKANLHDFRVVPGEHQTNFIFDLVIPYTYDFEQAAELMQNIRERVSAVDPTYQCIMSPENSFIGED